MFVKNNEYSAHGLKKMHGQKMKPIAYIYIHPKVAELAE